MSDLEAALGKMAPDDVASLRWGGGWVMSDLPCSERQAAINERAEEREAFKAAADEAEKAQERATRAMLEEQRGQERHTVGQFMAELAAKSARADAREEAKLHMVGCGCDSCFSGVTEPAKPDWASPPPPEPDVVEKARKKLRDREKAAAAAPATQGQLRKGLARLGAELALKIGRPS